MYIKYQHPKPYRNYVSQVRIMISELNGKLELPELPSITSFEKHRIFKEQIQQHISGIYFLFSEDGALIYIGKSIDIYSRFTVYASKRVWWFSKVKYYAIYQIQEDLELIEGIYIYHYKPMMNQHIRIFPDTAMNRYRVGKRNKEQELEQTKRDVERRARIEVGW